METPQILERKFLDGTIHQNHKTKWFNATEFMRLANSYRTQIGLEPKHIADYLKNQSTREFFEQIMDTEKISKVFDAKKGKNGGTWVHPLVLIDIAMWTNPKFKYEAMSWLQDNLVEFRDCSGDSYRKMSGVLSERIDPSKVGLAIRTIAANIKKLMNVDDWNATTPEKLQQRDRIHNNLILLMKANVNINKSQEIVFREEGLLNG